MAYKEIILGRKTRVGLYFFPREWTTPFLEITFNKYFIIEFGFFCFRCHLLHSFKKTKASFV